MNDAPGLHHAHTIPIELVRQKEWEEWVPKQTKETLLWTKSNRFEAKPGSFCILPGEEGDVARVFAGVSEKPDIWSLAGLPDQLPAGEYRIQNPPQPPVSEALMLGWMLGSYRFTRYKKDSRELATLLPPSGCNAVRVRQMGEAMTQARDLINTPANDMGPAELAEACRAIAESHGAEYSEIVGEALLKENYPAIHVVGQASVRAPRLIDVRWGDPSHPKVTLVGKGVCFDSGGLDIKPSSGMKLMKKDMGGAACMLAVARVIMARRLPVRLRLLVPAVENSISGNAYRPYDIINTRKGITVEVGNTDAEGRLILCDALWEADSERPELLIDCATLTGAARTALGPDVPALFTSDERLAADLLRHSREERDPLWRMPLWDGYREMLNSSTADINSAPDSAFAGAITAALYLKEFVPHTRAWAHIDMMAWNTAKRDGRPIGGEAMAVRTIVATIESRFKPADVRNLLIK